MACVFSFRQCYCGFQDPPDSGKPLSGYQKVKNECLTGTQAIVYEVVVVMLDKII